MGKIKPNFDNVVIGSNTIEEHKFQVLNFMNLIHNCAFEGGNKDGITPWTNNLKYKIKSLKWQLNKYWGYDIESHIDNLKENVKNGSAKESEWFILLRTLTKMFNLTYILN